MRCADGSRLSLLAIAAAPSPALAVQPDEMLPDPALEARARALSRELRCMVCQNQSIDDSERRWRATCALLVRERLKAGDSDAQVLDFLVARYGEFVLLKPRFGWDTALLWLAPAARAADRRHAALIVVLRRRRSSPQSDRTRAPQLSDGRAARGLPNCCAEPGARSRHRHKLLINFSKLPLSHLTKD